MVTHTRLELVLPTWEAGVLTARRMGQKMVPRVGLEPTTPSLRVICSTNWANEAKNIIQTIKPNFRTNNLKI